MGWLKVGDIANFFRSEIVHLAPGENLQFIARLLQGDYSTAGKVREAIHFAGGERNMSDLISSAAEAPARDEGE
jgi:hypothetical protein